MTTLYEHQQEACARGRIGNLALFHDPGTGKTLTTLHLIRFWKGRGFGPALVVCPLSIIEAAWITDCQTHMPELSIVSLWGTAEDRKKQLAKPADIYVINYEGLKIMYKDLDAKGFKVLVVDESSRMKDATSQQTKTLLALAGIISRGSEYHPKRIIPIRYCLSGTPAPNNEGEYWAQVKFITGPGNAAFPDNYYAFRGMYFSSIKFPSFTKWAFRASMREQLMAAMQPYCHVVRKADALDLPEQTHIVRDVYLSEPEQTAYSKFEKELVLRFEDTAVLATNALVEIMKLRQLTSGFIYHEDQTRLIGMSKKQALVDLLDELGPEQAIIWCNFKEEFRSVGVMMSATGRNYVTLDGQTEDREAAIRAFQGGVVQYLVANPQSAGHGLTFTNCSYCVYYSLSYSYEQYEQSLNRVHRIGQKRPCFYYYLLAVKTIDRLIYKVLHNKGDLSKDVLEWLKQKKQ